MINFVHGKSATNNNNAVDIWYVVITDIAKHKIIKKKFTERQKFSYFKIVGRYNNL